MRHLTVRPHRPPSAKTKEIQISENWEHYAQAVVRMHLPSGPVQVEPAEPGTTSGAYPAEGSGRPICVITAHNPRGEERTDGANRRLHRDLIHWLETAGLTFYPAAGGDREWLHVEEGVAVLGIDVEKARDIGRVFAQQAVFVWTPQTWQVVGCDDDTVVTLGWVTHSPSEELTKVDTAYRALRLESPLAPKPVIHAALEAALTDATPSEAAMLNQHYLDLVRAQYRSVREKQRVREERLEAERAQRREAERARKRAVEEEHLEAERVRKERDRTRRAERSARLRAARAKAKAQHEADVAAGWPEVWQPKHVQTWADRGGSAEQAVAFVEMGWPFDDLKAVADAMGTVAGLATPAQPHSHHAGFGETLLDVLTGTFPTAPEGGVLSMKRHFPSGRRERWFVVREQEASFRVEAHVCRPAGCWTSSTVGRWSSLQRAVRQVAALRNVRAEVLTEYVVPGMDTMEVARLLRVPARGRVVDHDLLDEDEYSWEESALVGMLENLEVEYRLVNTTVNARTLVAIHVGARWQWISPADSTWDEEALAGPVVAEVQWFSESGGAPISWDGGNRLTLVAPGVLDDRQWGDMGTERSLVPWPASARGRARVLAAWVERLEVELPAALVLEDWPREDQWLDWYPVEIWLTFDVEEDVLAALRRRLARSGVYRAARHAIRHPRSRLGRKLAVTLSEAAGSGFTGDLYGRWIDVTV